MELLPPFLIFIGIGIGPVALLWGPKELARTPQGEHSRLGVRRWRLAARRDRSTIYDVANIGLLITTICSSPCMAATIDPEDDLALVRAKVISVQYMTSTDRQRDWCGKVAGAAIPERRLSGRVNGSPVRFGLAPIYSGLSNSIVGLLLTSRHALIDVRFPVPVRLDAMTHGPITFSPFDDPTVRATIQLDNSILGIRSTDSMGIRQIYKAANTIGIKIASASLSRNRWRIKMALCIPNQTDDEVKGTCEIVVDNRTAGPVGTAAPHKHHYLEHCP